MLLKKTLRHGDFKPKMTPSSDCFGHIVHLECPLSQLLDA